jgi:hypothetical protein
MFKENRVLHKFLSFNGIKACNCIAPCHFPFFLAAINGRLPFGYEEREREREREKEKGQKRREGESEHCPKLFVQPRSEVFPLFQRPGSMTCAKLRLNLLPTVSHCALFASCIEWHGFVRCVHSSLPIHISHQPTVAHRGYHGQIRTWRRVRSGFERWGNSSHRR